MTQTFEQKGIFPLTRIYMKYDMWIKTQLVCIDEILLRELMQFMGPARRHSRHTLTNQASGHRPRRSSLSYLPHCTVRKINTSAISNFFVFFGYTTQDTRQKHPPSSALSSSSSRWSTRSSAYSLSLSHFDHFSGVKSGTFMAADG